MRTIPRRAFLKTTSISLGGAALLKSAPWLVAEPLGLPIGLQLYSVRDLLPKDYEGTLHQLAALGYREVEAAGFYGRSARDVKQTMDRVGLRCVSGHYSLDELGSDQTIQYAKDLGLDYMVCPSPKKNPARKKSSISDDELTLDDWRWNAEQFNQVGERIHAAGMHFAYHNHTGEFRSENGVVFYDELLRLTDPSKVSMQMDCGWVVVAGKNPIDYLTRYPKRISMFHVKDFKLSNANKTSEPVSAELGRGSIDYRPIFEAAKKAEIKHMFVEQEDYDKPALDSLKISAEYMRSMKV